MFCDWEGNHGPSGNYSLAAYRQVDDCHLWVWADCLETRISSCLSACIKYGTVFIVFYFNFILQCSMKPSVNRFNNGYIAITHTIQH